MSLLDPRTVALQGIGSGPLLTAVQGLLPAYVFVGGRVQPDALPQPPRRTRRRRREEEALLLALLR